MTQPRDNLEIDALVTDQYLDSLLAARARRGPASPPDAALDSRIRVAARALETQLTRVHPSFRFEDRLAADLQAAAHDQRGGRAASSAVMHQIHPGAAAFPRRLPATSDIRLPGSHLARPLLIGGALTSAAISIAGAYVALRRGRPAVDPMARAVRAARRASLTGRMPGRGLRRTPWHTPVGR